MKYLYIVLIATLIVSCKSNPIEQQKKAEEKVFQSNKAIENNKNKIEDKGKAFVYGAKYTNEQETNRTPAIDVSARFIDLAQLTLGNPSISDAQLMREIADGLILKYKAQIALAEIGVYTAEEKLKEERKRIASLEKSGQEAEKKLQLFSDLARFFKKLALLGIGAGLLVLILGIIGKAFPAFGFILDIFAKIAGYIGSLIFNFLPSAKKAAGVVSSSVFNALSHVVKATDEIFKKLKNKPIEDELIEHYPEDYKFSKKEVKDLLYKLTDETVKMLESELKAATNEESRTVIRQTKAISGIKQEKDNVQI